jgi:hypothetical protein
MLPVSEGAGMAAGLDGTGAIASERGIWARLSGAWMIASLGRSSAGDPAPLPSRPEADM